MSDFYFTEMEPGEEIVFGVVTSTSSVSATSSSVTSGMFGNSASHRESGHSEERKMGITNRRVIVEIADQPEAAQSIPLQDVAQVEMSRDKFMGTTRLTIAGVTTTLGQNVPLGIGLFDAEDEALVQKTFPAAAITDAGATVAASSSGSTSGEGDKPKKKGWFSFLGIGN